MTIDWNKEFPVTFVTRLDLTAAGFSEAQVALLTDEDMREIAAWMADIYTVSGYWEDLELVTNRTLQEKAQEDDSSIPSCTDDETTDRSEP